MFNQLIIRVKTRQFQMYNDYFSFFHSNSINKILTSKKIDQVILYRDLQFLDDETEYLKRAYYQTEAYNRIKKLISYYEKNMTPPSPILLTIEQYQYLDNRNRKILKLCIMKEKSQAQGQKQKRKSFMQSNGLKNSNMSAVADILPKLQETNLENIADSQRDESDEESYDSEVHDVFENFRQKAMALFVDGNQSGLEYREVLTIRNVKESDLVINFRTVNQPASDCNNCQNEPKIIVSSPPVNPLKFNTNKNSSSGKDVDVNQGQQKHQNYAGYQNHSQNHNQPLQSQAGFYPQQQPQTNAFQQGYQNNMSQNQNYPQGQVGMGLFSQQQVQMNQMSYQQQHIQQQQNTGQQVNEHNQFTPNNYNGNIFQSIQKSTSPKRIPSQQSSTNPNIMQNSNNYALPNSQGLSSSTNNVSSPSNLTTKNKKSKLSFMEYYHSVPNKSPTNILEKYMKRKK